MLIAGSGVCGAIHRAAGKGLEGESSKLGPLLPGQAVITKAYKLKSQYVIHTLGPVYRDHVPIEAAKYLSSCYRESIKLANSHSLSSIAFPAISTGIYGYPKMEAAQIAVNITFESLKLYPIREVVFCVFDNDTLEIYEKVI